MSYQQLMTDISISVVTPSYNQSEFIEDNLQSVMNQSGADIEHVVVDGGSTDRTTDILEEYENRYNLQWISEPDNGQSDAINKGIEQATGDWIWWVNSDDYLLPNAVEKFANKIGDRDGCDVVYGDYIFVDSQGNEIDRKYSTRPSPFIHKHYYQFTGNHSAVIRRDVLQSLGGVDESLDYVMDTELLWRLLEADLDYIQIDSFLAARRLHEEAKTTGTPPVERLTEIRELKRQYHLSWYENVIPTPVLTVTAICLEGFYHTIDGRPHALRYLTQ